MAYLSPLSLSSAPAPHISRMYLTSLQRYVWRSVEQRAVGKTPLYDPAELGAKNPRALKWPDLILGEKSRKIDNYPALVSKIIVENVLAMTKWLRKA